jgi:hypothetical protein
MHHSTIHDNACALAWTFVVDLRLDVDPVAILAGGRIDLVPCIFGKVNAFVVMNDVRKIVAIFLYSSMGRQSYYN